MATGDSPSAQTTVRAPASRTSDEHTASRGGDAKRRGARLRAQASISAKTLWTRLVAWLRADLHGKRYAPFGLALALLTILALALYYSQTAVVVRDPDTPAYLAVAHHIARQGKLVDDTRLPGYPLLLLIVFALAGRGNLLAVGVAQAVLFTLATLEVYAIVCLIARRAWLACAVALLVGTNLRIISYVKPILSEGLTLFLTVSLALAVVVFLQRPSQRGLWIVFACMLALFMTRPEWMYLPVPLAAYLLLVAWRRGLTRRFLPHALGGVGAVYAVLALYIFGNFVVNGYAGVTYIQNLNLLGKVMEYHMQNEAPARYAQITQLINQHQAAHDNDPWHIAYPPLQRDHFALAGRYAESIILRHLGEFLSKSWALGVHTLHTAYPFHTFTPTGPLAPALLWLDGFSATTLGQMYWLLVLAPFWWAIVALGVIAARVTPARRLLQQERLMGWSARLNAIVSPQRLIEMAELFGALALLAVYDWALTTLGGYVYFERLHAPFDPLLMIIVYGSAGLALLALTRIVGVIWRTRRQQ